MAATVSETPSPWLSALLERRRFGMRPGLETIGRVLAALGHPERRLHGAVHIAGTNGKGATAAFLEAALLAHGERVGRYTSPHLVALNERFFLDGRPAPMAALERAARQVEAVGGAAELSYFEFLTALAFVFYAGENPSRLVLETGLGGRLDATNVVRSELAVITRLGLDHCEWLGDTVEQIAFEKAGIIKPGVPVVLGENEPGVCEVVAARARELGSPLYYAPDLVAADEVPHKLALAGSFNRENARTALAALRVLGVDAVSARRGLEGAVWPGRFQRVGRYLVDGAHNPPAATALKRALQELAPGERFDLVAGFCGDKDVEATLAILKPLVRRAWAVQTANPRSLKAAELAVLMARSGLDAVAAPSLEAALKAADGERVLVCGSLFLAGEALVALGAYPWPIPAGAAVPAEALRKGGAG